MRTRPRVGEWTAAEWFVLRSAGLPRSALTGLLAPSRLLGRGATTDEVTACRAEELRVLRNLAASPGLRLAVSWQNGRMLRDVLDPLIKSAELPRNAKRRQREQTAAKYLQRYTTKNETIGHFGPSAWGQFSEGPNEHSGSGETLTATVRWELWAWSELTAAMSADPLVWPHCTVVRNALVHLDGDAAHVFGQRLSLTSIQRDALRNCTRPTLVSSLPRDVLETLMGLGLVEVQVSLDPEDPAASLRRFLQSRVPNPARDRWLGVLNEAESRLACLVNPDLKAEEVASTLNEAANWLTETTGAPADRNPGRTYGARTPVFCDARRDVELTLDTNFFARVPALEGVLDSGARISQAAADAMEATFDRVLADRTSVSLATVWHELVSPAVASARTAAVESAAIERERWYRAVGICDNGIQHFSTTWNAVRERLPVAPTRSSDWTGASVVSPDLLLRGVSGHLPSSPRIVLGEVHLGVATMLQRAFTVTHPSIDRLRLEIADLAQIRREITPIEPDYSVPRKSYRTGLDTRVTPGPYLALRTLPHEMSSEWLPAHALTIFRAEAGWNVMDEDGRAYPLIDVFSTALTAIVVDKLQFSRPNGHTPRITIDDLVLTRESWVFDQAESAFGRFPNDQRTLRAFLADRGAPESGYLKTMGEKPVFVDARSPTYTDLFLKSLRSASRRNASLRFTEELPTGDELWLRDIDEELLTSEIRLTFYNDKSTA